jgi:hypothetical protein
MKCPKCGKLWSDSNAIASRTYRCPFCGETYDDTGHQRNNIKKVLASIVDRYGEEILQDTRRVNALLMDLATESDKERKLIVMSLREGILSQLYTAKENSMSEVVMSRCVKQLVSDRWITENAARYAVEIIASVIGVEFIGTIPRGDCDTNFENINTPREVIIQKGDKKVRDDVELERSLSDVCTIGYKAFAANDAITHVRLPQPVKKVMPKAFAYCRNITEVEFNSDIVAISTSAFDGCANISEIRCNSARYVCKNGVLLDRVERKTIKAENRKNLDTIKIPTGIRVVTDRTFEGNCAVTMQITDSVEIIEDKAFQGMSNLQNIVVESHNKKYCSIDGVLHNKERTELIKYPKGKQDSSYYIEDTVNEIGKYSFSLVQNLKMITFTGNLVKIEYAAFQFCSNLESLMLPCGVSLIGEKAFQFCSKLKSVMLSPKIVEIGDCAFYKCISLDNVVIPENVERIGNYAFGGCTDLKSVIIHHKVNEIGYAAFEGCGNICIKIRDNIYVENYCKAHNIEFSII